MILCAVTLIAQIAYLDIGFVATDSLPLIDSSRITSFSDVVALFANPVLAGTSFVVTEVVYRPVASLTFGLEYLAWGMNPMGYHVVNLGLHLAAVLLLWRLLLSFGLNRWSAVGGATLFSVHPVTVASVPVIARLDSLLPVPFLLGAWLLLEKAQRPDARHRTLLFALSLLLAAIALLSKESVFAVIGLLPVFVALRAAADGSSLNAIIRRALTTVPYLVLAFALFALRFRVLGGLGRGGSDFTGVGPDMYAQVAGAYLRDLLWFPSAYAPSTAAFWPRLGIFLLLAVTATCLALPRRQACIALIGVVWVAGIGFFAMVFQVATVGWLAYLALPGIAILVAAGIEGAICALRLSFARRVGSGLVAAGLLVATAGWLGTSPLVRTYDQWIKAGTISRQYAEALQVCATSAPGITNMRLEGLPSTYDDQQPETGQLGVTLFEGYTVASVLHLVAPAQEMTFTIWSQDTVSATTPTMQLQCVPDSPTPHTATLSATF